jgi:hypothetical protein
MDTDHAAVASNADASQDLHDPFSAEWWQERTTTELRDIIKRGFGLGPAYDGAVAETERRARETVRRVREEQDATARRNSKLRLMVLSGILAAMLAIGLFDWLAF